MKKEISLTDDEISVLRIGIGTAATGNDTHFVSPMGTDGRVACESLVSRGFMRRSDRPDEIMWMFGDWARVKGYVITEAGFEAYAEHKKEGHSDVG